MNVSHAWCGTKIARIDRRRSRGKIDVFAGASGPCPRTSAIGWRGTEGFRGFGASGPGKDLKGSGPAVDKGPPRSRDHP